MRTPTCSPRPRRRRVGDAVGGFVGTEDTGRAAGSRGWGKGALGACRILHLLWYCATVARPVGLLRESEPGVDTRTPFRSALPAASVRP